MRSENTIQNKEYLDFCGKNELDFGLMDQDKADDFIAGISKNLSFSELAELFSEDVDQLAYCAVYAFSTGLLSRAATATFLEYRSMKKDFPAIMIIDIDDVERRPEYINEIMSGYFVHSNDKDKCLKLIQKMPRYEACVFRLTFLKII